jgi:uncharacterized protein (DUF2252 family)
MNTTKNIAERIVAYNAPLLPDMVALKYDAMRSSEFSFFRGTAHLFYEDLPVYLPLLASPNVWVCGDLHLSNFGSYRGDNLLAYFDINDFDEATLAPALFDVGRFVVSLFVAADSLGFDKESVRHLSNDFIDTYAKTLEQGYVRHFEQAIATGLMKTFLDKVQSKSHTKFLASRVENGEKIIIKPQKTIKLSKEAQLPLLSAFKKWASKTENPAFFEVIDIVFRISGTGSLGVERYVALVQGDKKTKPDVLIDIKETLPSVIERYLSSAQYPSFENNAARAVELQKRIQSVPPALLSTFTFNDKSFIIKELQPMSDKIDFSHFKNHFDNLEDILDKMAKIIAWGQLRSSGRQGSATVDTLIAFAQDSQNWHEPLMDFVEQYADKVRADYWDYIAAYDKGFFNKKA